MKKNIVISNIYGKYNLGDQAIRNSALKLLNEIYKDGEFHLLCESINNFRIDIPKNMKVSTNYAPYGYAIDSKNKAKPLIKKFFILFIIIITSLVFVIIGKINRQFLPSKGFFSYISRILEADLVFLMGGGYLVTKYKYKDFFGVLLNSIPLFVAKAFNKKIIVLPISFGPFASKYHADLLGKALRGTKLYCRDNISLSYVKKYNKEAKYMPDLALYDWGNYEK